MKWLFIGLMVLLLAAFFIIRSDFFNIKKVDIQLDKVECTNTDQIRSVTNTIGANIILLNPSYIKDTVKSKFLCVKDVFISRKFPNTVRMNVLGRERKALLLALKREASESADLENIATPSAEGLGGIEGLEVDEEGIIFAKSAPRFNLPRIYLHDDLALGQLAPATTYEALKILDKVKFYSLNVSDSEILDNSFIIYPKAGVPKIILKLERNLDTQLASLQLILNQAKIDEKVVEFIDLRFDKPVIRLAPKKN